MQLRILQVEHLRHLFCIRPRVPGFATQLERLAGCTPIGALFRRTGGSRGPGFPVCELAHLCPWCLARRVSKLYERFSPIVSRSPSLLVTLTLTVTDVDLCRSPADRASFVRKTLGRELRTRAEMLGAIGGLTAVQFGPRRHTTYRVHEHEVVGDEHDGFEYRVSVLAHLREATDEFRAVVDNPVEAVPCLPIGDRHRAPSVYIRPGDQYGLRHSLFGTSAKAPGRLDYESAGDPGVFNYFPWFLSTPPQWADFVDLSRSQRLYSTWGTWHATGNSSRSPRRSSGGTRDEVLSAANDERSQRVANRRTELTEEVRPIFDELCRKRGKPPGRVAMRKACAAADIDISERDARDLLKRLTPTEEN